MMQVESAYAILDLAELLMVAWTEQAVLLAKVAERKLWAAEMQSAVTQNLRYRFCQ